MSYESGFCLASPRRSYGIDNTYWLTWNGVAISLIFIIEDNCWRSRWDVCRVSQKRHTRRGSHNCILEQIPKSIVSMHNLRIPNNVERLLESDSFNEWTLVFIRFTYFLESLDPPYLLLLQSDYCIELLYRKRSFSHAMMNFRRSRAIIQADYNVALCYLKYIYCSHKPKTKFATQNHSTRWKEMKISTVVLSWWQVGIRQPKAAILSSKQKCFYLTMAVGLRTKYNKCI